MVAKCIACLDDPGFMGNGLLIYVMVTKDAGQSNGANRVISINKRQTDYPTAVKLDILAFDVLADLIP